MRIVIITESAFGNTRAVADAVAAGARSAGADVEVYAASDAPLTLPAGTDLLVLAAPTHNRHLPTPSTRKMAARQGGQIIDSGIREWLASATPNAAVRLVTLDTTTNLSGAAGSAAKSAATEAARRGFASATTASFRVAGTPPVLTPGEEERAHATGQALATGTPLPPTPAPTYTARRHGLLTRWWFWGLILALVIAIVSVWVLLTPNPNVGNRAKLAVTHPAAQQAKIDSVVVPRAELASATTPPRVWVAIDGVVYDLSAVPPWASGLHHGVRAGTDATEQFVASGHGSDTLVKLPVVGRLGT